jgi:hypothetical protein
VVGFKVLTVVRTKKTAIFVEFHGDAFQKKIFDINLIHMELGDLNPHNMGLTAGF